MYGETTSVGSNQEEREKEDEVSGDRMEMNADPFSAGQGRREIGT